MENGSFLRAILMRFKNELDLMIKKHNVKNHSSYDFLNDSDYREFCKKELKEPLNKLVLK